MNGALDGMHDIIPPMPVHGGLTAWVDPAGGHPALLAILMIVLALAPLALWFGRHRLRTAIRRARAERALRSLPPAQAAELIARLLQRQLGLAHLHAEHPPAGIDAQTWSLLVSVLHQARFSTQPVELGNIASLLAQAFTTASITGAEGERVSGHS